MATTIGSFSAIDDTEVDAESPITETLVTRLRDNSYWIDAGTRKTTQTSQTKVLVPDGSGGVAWVEANTVAGIDGTKGSGTISASSGSPTQIAVIANKILNITILDDTGPASLVGTIDTSDESCDIISTATSSSNLSVTLTSSYQSLDLISGSVIAFFRVTGGNYEIYISSGGTAKYLYNYL